MKYRTWLVYYKRAMEIIINPDCDFQRTLHEAAAQPDGARAIVESIDHKYYKKGKWRELS